MKEMSKVKVYEKNSIQSIVNERRMLAHLRHPYVIMYNFRFLINMHYAFQDKENLYIVLDYLSGGDLRYHICQNKKKFTEEQASKYFVTIEFFIACLLITLEYLHHNNIMHRDIKPENLVFDKQGYLYLTDMGIAKLCRVDKTIIDSSGTPGYMAPEVISNNNHDIVSDYFAIGVMAYEFMFSRVSI
jgi:serum/glucocorticoid-regulated kinase 2